jgi:glycosyltransferase involved in cell wall biosynthesis
MVGTVEPRKGYDTALAALRRLRASHPHSAVNLLIAGRPGWKTRLLQWRIRRMASMRADVRWMRDARDEFVSELYRACTVYLCCSRGEGFGLPIAEALHYGAPVVASDLPVFRELDDGKIRFFRAGDPNDLAAVLAQVLNPACARPAPESYARADKPAAPDWAATTDAILAAIGADSGQRLTRGLLTQG